MAIITFSMAMLLPMLSSCSSDESSSGRPEITYIRVADPEKADSTFVKAWPGAQIVIMGRNLSHATKVYINDQSVSFNPTLNTDHSIVVNIPTEEDGFKLVTWNDDVSSEIRVVTPGGEATFPFLVMNPIPEGQVVLGHYPRQAGVPMKFIGTNLLDIVRVYITDMSVEEIENLKDDEIISGNQVEITGYDCSHNHYLDSKTKRYVTESVMTFDMPEISFDKGAVVVECEAGYAYAEYARLPPMPAIASVSSDMPVTGEEVLITGKNFIQVESVKYGDIVIGPDDIKVSESEDSIYFKMLTIPTAEKSTLTVTTPAGENSVAFFDKSTVLFNFDDKGVDLNWSPNAKYAYADGVNPPYTSDGRYGWFDVMDYGSTFWGTMINWAYDYDGNVFSLPGFDVIPAETPADDVYLAMEVYNDGTPLDDNTTTLFISYNLSTLNQGDTGWYNWVDPDHRQEPVFIDLEGNAYINRWYRSAIPFSRFGTFSGKTYQDIVNSGIKSIRLQVTNYLSNPVKISLCVDNIRIITAATQK